MRFSYGFHNFISHIDSNFSYPAKPFKKFSKGFTYLSTLFTNTMRF
ncbi:hypothetical protein [Helicobacter cinaedi]|nr:hypothetical protein [Helicobacter cinaedi]